MSPHMIGALLGVGSMLALLAWGVAASIRAEREWRAALAEMEQRHRAHMQHLARMRREPVRLRVIQGGRR